MSNPTFNGSRIFGSQVRQTGPIPKVRSQRETLPGVKGYRIYNLTGKGADTLTFHLRGRFVAGSIGAIERAIASAAGMMGGVGTFVSAGGVTYKNCELQDYRQAGPIQTCVIQGVTRVTCEIQATIEQAGGAGSGGGGFPTLG